MTAILSPLRDGRITASRAASVLGISGAYQSRKAVHRELVRQAWGDPDDTVVTRAMSRGHKYEANAIAAYEAETGVLVHSQQQFFIHPDHDWLGATVDALVGDDGLVEAKAPSEMARYYTVEDKPIFDAQIRVQLECTGRVWGDLAVWRDGQPVSISRVWHDPLWLPSVLPRLESFMDTYRATVADADAATLVRFQGAELVAELVRQRDLARNAAAALEAENASLLDTLRDRELAS